MCVWTVVVVAANVATWPRMIKVGVTMENQLPHLLTIDQVGKPARQYRWWKMTFLQIRNNSNRSWKAQEYLIFKWKCIPEWLFTDSHISGPRNEKWAIGLGED